MSSVSHLSLQGSNNFWSAPVQKLPGIVSDYTTQSRHLALLEVCLESRGSLDNCFEFFSNLDPDLQLRCYEHLCSKPRGKDNEDLIKRGIDRFLSNPAALLTNIAQLHLYVMSRVPSLEERTIAVGNCLGGILPRGIVSFIAQFAAERFDHEIFGPQLWRNCWGAIPVTLPPIDELRSRVNGVATSTGKQPRNQVEMMTAVECANFLGLPGEEEHPELSEEMHLFLNRRARPEDRLLSAFTCAVTYIPQYVRKGNKILAVNANTIALVLGQNPLVALSRTAQLTHSSLASYNGKLSRKYSCETEPSCYFMMRQEIDARLDEGWEIPEPRNFIATVFARYVWIGQYLFSNTHTLTLGMGPEDDNPFAGGGFGPSGLTFDHARTLQAQVGQRMGVAGSRKFLPK